MYYPTKTQNATVVTIGVGKCMVDKRSIRGCRNIGTSDKEELDSLAEAFAHVLSSLNVVEKETNRIKLLRFL